MMNGFLRAMPGVLGSVRRAGVGAKGSVRMLGSSGTMCKFDFPEPPVSQNKRFRRGYDGQYVNEEEHYFDYQPDYEWKGVIQEEVETTEEQGAPDEYKEIDRAHALRMLIGMFGIIGAVFSTAELWSPAKEIAPRELPYDDLKEEFGGRGIMDNKMR
mmetsp:Transcript_20226/g.56923  ORF Transcript_20226/g.56923 Transcript_20226/m.56923 type:complete len:157 (+) Transcript_20226:74-544(+)|eukprot:CAMPEP_0119122206 /NCGR_PEP_ID=MMETSP1310-20130426/2532_1 /TAXON_ID=464262 /ORGANISM="Genus nov. species nov., Strain RCC2339" /LENGTH=156 /DNA_ID=CAMNT_0007111829 /DNA_START=209 /DNA_END=679 /DNA_ORIENTATION=+